MKRLFVAIELPDFIREPLVNIQEPALRGFHWVSPGNLHLTLKFIGDVDSELQEAIEHALAPLSTEPFILPVEGVGQFPERGPGFVVWAGMGTGHPRLFGLKKGIEDSLFRIGIEPELRRYTPHITLARCKEASAESVRQYLKRHREFSAPPFRVSGFALYSSHQMQGNSVYTLERRWEFNTPAEG